MTTLRLLVTCVGGELSPYLLGMLKNSRRHRLTLVGVDVRGDAAGRVFVDHFETVPRGSDPAYVDRLLAIADRYGADMIYPTSDEEVLALSAQRERIEGGGRILACNDQGVIRIVTNKADTYRYLDGIGISTPDWCQVKTADAVVAAVTALVEKRGAAVVKPAIARGGRGIYVVSKDGASSMGYQGSREIHTNLQAFAHDCFADVAKSLPVVVMERLVEPVFDVDMLGWKGRPQRVVARRRLSSALPNEGHVIVQDERLERLGWQLIEALHASWLLDCDVMFNERGEPQVLEINPRASGSVAVTVTAGVPLLEDMISLAKGEPIENISLPYGRKVIPYKALTSVSE